MLPQIQLHLHNANQLISCWLIFSWVLIFLFFWSTLNLKTSLLNSRVQTITTNQPNPKPPGCLLKRNSFYKTCENASVVSAIRCGGLSIPAINHSGGREQLPERCSRRRWQQDLLWVVAVRRGFQDSFPGILSVFGRGWAPRCRWKDASLTQIHPGHSKGIWLLCVLPQNFPGAPCPRAFPLWPWSCGSTAVPVVSQQIFLGDWLLWPSHIYAQTSPFPQAGVGAPQKLWGCFWTHQHHRKGKEGKQHPKPPLEDFFPQGESAECHGW